MLDDMNVIRQRDPQDSLAIAGGSWSDFEQGFDVTFTASQPIKNVVWAGMGGSALPAVIMQSWPRLTVPFEIVRDYDIPPFVGADTLFIASSYSGNTEETIEALHQAEQKQAQIVVITSGGKLAQLAEAAGYPLFKLPTGIQPRMETFYFVNAMLHIVRPLEVVHEDDKELFSVGEWLKGEVEAWKKEVPLAENIAKQLATQIVGKTIVVYSGPKLFPAANKWKICLNENAKNTAWANQYPELNHNEFIGWTSHPVEKPFAMIEIRSNLEHERTLKRFEVTEKLLSGKRPAPIVVTPRGDTLLQQLAWTFALGDFVSIYLGILNGVNPMPVELVEKLKHELG